MRVPISWLRDYVDIHMDAASLADRLTMTGTKVEGLVSVGEQLKDIVACKVVELNAHPTNRWRRCASERIAHWFKWSLRPRTWR